MICECCTYPCPINPYSTRQNIAPNTCCLNFPDYTIDRHTNGTRIFNRNSDKQQRVYITPGYLLTEADLGDSSSYPDRESEFLRLALEAGMVVYSPGRISVCHGKKVLGSTTPDFLLARTFVEVTHYSFLDPRKKRQIDTMRQAGLGANYAVLLGQDIDAVSQSRISLHDQIQHRLQK